jgi:hypothetical protein
LFLVERVGAGDDGLSLVRFIVPADEHFLGDHGGEISVDVDLVNDVETGPPYRDEAELAAVGDSVDRNRAVMFGLEMKRGAERAAQFGVAGPPAVFGEREVEDGVVGGIEALGIGLVGELVERRHAAGEDDAIRAGDQAHADAR